MKIRSSASSFALRIAAAVVFATGVANADITTESRVSVQGVGIMSFANMSGTTRTAITASRARTDSNLQLESKLVRFLARGAAGPSAEIVRLDTDKLLHLDINKKEYTEQSFEDLRARLQKGLNGTTGDDSGKERAQPSPIDQSKCDLQPARTDVRKTGEKGTFAGYDAERVIITAEQPCKDRETGAICEIALTLDEWMAPRFATSDEVAQFRKAYAQKIGLDSAFNSDATDRAKALFSQYKGAWSEVVAKMKDVKGYPVKSSFALSLGGEQCQKDQQSSDSGSSSNGGSTSAADIAGKVGAKLGSLFHKKQDDAAPPAPDASSAGAAAAPAAATPAGTVTFITVNSEIASVSTAAIPADEFEVPVGFKKIESRGAAPQ